MKLKKIIAFEWDTSFNLTTLKEGLMIFMKRACMIHCKPVQRKRIDMFW